PSPRPVVPAAPVSSVPQVMVAMPGRSAETSGTPFWSVSSHLPTASALPPQLPQLSGSSDQALLASPQFAGSREPRSPGAVGSSGPAQANPSTVGPSGGAPVTTQKSEPPAPMVAASGMGCWSFVPFGPSMSRTQWPRSENGPAAEVVSQCSPGIGVAGIGLPFG